MNTSLFVLLLVIGSAASLSLPSLQLPNKQDPIKTVCTIIPLQRELATMITQRITDMVSKDNFKQRFPATTTYVTTAENKNKLLQGGTQCEQFFQGLQTAFQIDIQQLGQAGQSVRDQFFQFINSIAQIQSLFG